MESIILTSDRFSAGVFLLNENRKEYVPFKEAKYLYLTQEDNCSLKDEIINIIKQSKKVLKICSFILTDKEVFQALLEKAKENSVAIFILTQLDQNKLYSSSMLTEEELFENPSQSHLDCIKKLYDQGVHVRASTTAHAKFIISDREIAFFTSANLTTPSLSINTESGLYLEKPEVESLDLLFDVIFQKGTLYKKYLTASKKKQFIIQSEDIIDPQWLPDVEKSKLKYTYEILTNSLYKEILRIILNADKYIFLSSYSIVNLEALPEFVEAIKKAISKKVEIYIFCRGMNYRPDHLKSCEKLANFGCMIFGDFYNHSKGIINEKEGLIFTANIDGNHGLKDGFEIGALLNHSQRDEFLRFHEYLISSSIYKFELLPVILEFFKTYSIYEKIKNQSPPLFPDIVVIRLNRKDVVDIDLFKTSPIFLSVTKSSESYLFVGENVFGCTRDQGVFLVTEKIKYRVSGEKYLIKYKKLQIEVK